MWCLSCAGAPSARIHADADPLPDPRLLHDMHLKRLAVAATAVTAPEPLVGDIGVKTMRLGFDRRLIFRRRLAVGHIGKEHILQFGIRPLVTVVIGVAGGRITGPRFSVQFAGNAGQEIRRPTQATSQSFRGHRLPLHLLRWHKSASSGDHRDHRHHRHSSCRRSRVSNQTCVLAGGTSLWLESCA